MLRTNLIVFFIALSCSSFNKNEDQKNRFDAKLISHFPTENYNLLREEVSFPDKDIETNMGVWLFSRFSLEGYLDGFVNDKIEHLSPLAYDGNCVLILPTRDYRDWKIEEPVISECMEETLLVPLPSFINKFQENGSNPAPESISFYIIETRKGKYLPENLLFKDGTMPSKWEHGLSRGVAVDTVSKEAIFWIEIW